MSAGAAAPILVVESDRRVAEALTRQLLADGYSVEVARTPGHARVLADRRPPCLALLGDVDAPRGALALLEEIRASANRSCEWDPAVPAVMLAGAGGELDALRAFEAGADDFVLRRAGYLELRARLRAILRRRHDGQVGRMPMRIGPLRVDGRSRTVTVAGRPVDLRRLEFELLVHLAAEPKRVFTREELLCAIWGYAGDAPTRTLDSHASRLRRKLGDDGGRRWVVAVRGVGYSLI